MAEPAPIRVEVTYALAQRQWRVLLTLPEGSTVADAIERSNLRLTIRDLVIDDEHVGIFGRTVTLATVLHEGDRVEIYRPLQCDPKEVRRQRAARSSPAKPRPSKPRGAC